MGSNIDQGGMDEGETYVCPLCNAVVYHAISPPLCLGINGDTFHQPRLMKKEGE